VAVISQAFADRYFGGEDPVGRRIVRVGTTLTVIGVVDDVRDVTLTQATDPTLYLNYIQQNNQTAPVSLVLRTAGDPLALAPAVRAAVFSVDPAQPVDHLLTLDQFLADSLGPDRFRTTLLAVFAGLALLLSAVGVYGVTARSAAERTREMGVRLAMGAAPSQVWRLVVGQGMAVVLAGVIAGAAAAMPAGLAITRALSGVDAEGAVTGSALPAAVALAGAAFVACALPARRVLRVDPVTVLRE
jgi:putative ABC transport system permease protein